MRNATIFLSILITSLVLSATDVTATEEIYRWVDENGVVHFGDRADTQENAELVEMQKAPDATNQADSASTETTEAQPSYAQKLRDERAEEKRLREDRRREITDLCAQHRQNVASLEPMPRVMVQRADGSVDRMDDNERLEKLAESKTFIAENCDQ